MHELSLQPNFPNVSLAALRRGGGRSGASYTGGGGGASSCGAESASRAARLLDDPVGHTTVPFALVAVAVVGIVVVVVVVALLCVTSFSTVAKLPAVLLILLVALVCRLVLVFVCVCGGFGDGVVCGLGVTFSGLGTGPGLICARSVR